MFSLFLAHHYILNIGIDMTANSADPDQAVKEQSDQGPHCLPFHLSLMNIQSTLVISTSVISNNRFSRRKNLVLV